MTRAVDAVRAGRNLLIVSPTGSGKSLILAETHHRLGEQGVLLCPSIEIALGVYRRLPGSWPTDEASEATIRDVLATRGLYTIKQYHNLILAGEVQPPAYILIDESHHATDATHTIVFAAAGNPPRIGLTATPFRGTPAETQKLRELWPDRYVALSLADAAEKKIIAVPRFVVWPLLNDDLIDVQGGEFVTRAVESAITDDVLEDLIERMSGFVSASRWDRPTLLRVPGVASAGRIAEQMSASGLPAIAITGGDCLATRNVAFAACVKQTAAIVQVKVIGEGVDIPARRLIDLAPTMSPVAWQQALGRITRPTDEQPEYIACNHNLSRHAYLFAGLIPPAAIRDAQQAWGPEYKPIRRTMARALGLEGFGRFKPEVLPMKDGTAGAIYALQTPDGLHQYCVLLHPTRPDPLYFERQNALTGKMLEHKLPDGKVIEYAEKTWGRWKKIDAVPNAEGYVSVKPGVLTPSMKDWWKRSAESRGFDPEAEINARQFVALACCCDTRTRL